MLFVVAGFTGLTYYCVWLTCTLAIVHSPRLAARLGNVVALLVFTVLVCLSSWPILRLQL